MYLYSTYIDCDEPKRSKTRAKSTESWHLISRKCFLCERKWRTFLPRGQILLNSAMSWKFSFSLFSPFPRAPLFQLWFLRSLVKQPNKLWKKNRKLFFLLSSHSLSVSLWLFPLYLFILLFTLYFFIQSIHLLLLCFLRKIKTFQLSFWIYRFFLLFFPSILQAFRDDIIHPFPAAK